MRRQPRLQRLRQGVGALIRQAGLRVMELLMEEEVRERGSYVSRLPSLSFRALHAT